MVPGPPSTSPAGEVADRVTMPQESVDQAAPLCPGAVAGWSLPWVPVWGQLRGLEAPSAPFPRTLPGVEQDVGALAQGSGLVTGGHLGIGEVEAGSTGSELCVEPAGLCVRCTTAAGETEALRGLATG